MAIVIKLSPDWRSQPSCDLLANEKIASPAQVIFVRTANLVILIWNNALELH
jgi:hypothetical protein